MSGPQPGPNYRKAIELRLRGHSYQDIAVLLAISRSRVGQIMENAVKRGDLPHNPFPKKRSAQELLDKRPAARQTEE